MWEQELSLSVLERPLGEIAVWCTTSDAADELFEYLHSEGWRWNSWSPLLGDTRWGCNGYLNGGAYWLCMDTHTVRQSSTLYAESEHNNDRRFVFHGQLSGRQLVMLDDLL